MILASEFRDACVRACNNNQLKFGKIYVSGGSGITFGGIRVDLDKHQRKTGWFTVDVKSDSEKQNADIKSCELYTNLNKQGL